MPSATSPSRVSLPTAIRGAAVGVLAYVVGYAFTYLTAAGSAQRLARAYQPLAEAGGRFAPAWKVAGWTFYDAHFVGTRFAGQTVNMVSFASVEYLYLVPPLVLLLAGAVVAFAADSESPRAGTVAGTTVTLGYLPLVVLLALWLPYANVEPSLLRALVVAGVVYPVAFGGVGGALAAVVRGDRSA